MMDHESEEHEQKTHKKTIWLDVNEDDEDGEENEGTHERRGGPFSHLR